MQAVVRQSQFDHEQLSLIRATVAKGTTPEQFRLFIEVCTYHSLNPFARQIYAVVRGGQMTIQTGIDGYRLLAERSGKYAGQIGPHWCGPDGEWVDVWLKDEPPVAARIGVLRKDFAQPTWGIAKYKSYVQPSSPLWSKMADTMLAKCAESLALRKAFPAEMSGIYTAEEMAQADEPLPTMTVDAEIASVVPQNGHSVEQASSQVPAQKVVKIEAERESGASQDGHATEQQRAAIASMAKSLSIVVELASDATFEEARAKIVELQQQIRQRRTAVASK